MKTTNHFLVVSNSTDLPKKLFVEILGEEFTLKPRRNYKLELILLDGKFNELETEPSFCRTTIALHEDGIVVFPEFRTVNGERECLYDARLLDMN